MRNPVTKTQMVEKKVWVADEVVCDLCGFDEDETMIFVVHVGIDPDGCAGTSITRDVCQDCYDIDLAPLFTPLLEKLLAGDRHLTNIHEDRWYG